VAADGGTLGRRSGRIATGSIGAFERDVRRVKADHVLGRCILRASIHGRIGEAAVSTAVTSWPAAATPGRCLGERGASNRART